MKKFVLLLICFLVLGLGGGSWGAEFCVSHNTPTELHGALATAEANGEDDIIKVEQGTYLGNFTFNSSDGKSITLLGGYTVSSGCASREVDPSRTTLNAQGSGRVLYLYNSNGGDITVDGFTIENGDGGSGSGVYARSDSPSGNAGNITLINNHVIGNIAGAGGCGGGVFIYSKANSGDSANITLTANTIMGNSADEHGGGIYATTISYPSGNSGKITLTNNVIAGNTATKYHGAGVYANSSASGITGDVTLTNNTITGNTAGGYGGGLHVGMEDNTMDVYNNIIWGNTASMGGGDIDFYGTGLANGCKNDYSDIYGSWTSEGGNIDVDPVFVGGGDYHLQSISPCIDAGTNSAPELPDTDVDGDPRIADGDNDGNAVVDIGADELVIWFVDGENGVDPDDCSGGHSWGSAFRSIGKAISCAHSGEEIWVKGGTYRLSSQIEVDKGVAIYGGFDGTETQRDQRDWQNNVTTVDGQDSVRCFFITTWITNATVDGFTITNGNALYGGGIYNSLYVSPTITNCTLSWNHATYSGGGIRNLDNSSPTIANCDFLENSAGEGGGGIMNGNSGPTITNCDFSENSAAERGGGIYNVHSSPTITNCTFSENSAEIKGGGIYNEHSDPNITNCTFSGNTAKTGGGIFNFGSAPTTTNCCFSGNSALNGAGIINNESSNPNITNCTFSGNWADTDAGAMWNLSSSPIITNCTFSGNSAIYVGGILNEYDSSPTITNCILWEGTATSMYEILSDWTCSPTITYCDIDQDGFDGINGNIRQDPLFVGGGDYHLQSTSPCIDAGTNDAPNLPATDFEGDLRIIDGDNDGTATVDMGVDEYTPPPAVRVTKIDSSKLDGPYTVGEEIEITLTFSEEVTLSAGGTLTVTLDTGGMAEIYSIDSQRSVSVTYTVEAGDNSSDLNVSFLTLSGGTLQNGDGIDCSLSLPTGSNLADSKDIIIDTVAPSSSVTALDYGNGTFSMPWTASDATSGVASIQLWYKAPGRTWANTGLGAQAGTSGTFSYTPTDGDGTYYFATRSTDNAGNVEEEPSGDGDISYTITGGGGDGGGGGCFIATAAFG